MKYTYFNFKKWNDQQILLTNDLGRWAFVSLPTFQAMLLHRLDSTDPSYAELLEKGFLYEDDAERTMRMFIWSVTAVPSEKQKAI